MTLTAPVPTEFDDGASAPRDPENQRSAGWFVRITILAVVLLWLVPVAGVLVTSFRPEALVDTTGWWTVFAHPFRSGEWTLDNYRQALDAGGFENAFLNSVAVAVPATIIPITIA